MIFPLVPVKRNQTNRRWRSLAALEVRRSMWKICRMKTQRHRAAA
jgi:hypothetical protein